jgi:hypothetical protein
MSSYNHKSVYFVLFYSLFLIQNLLIGQPVALRNDITIKQLGILGKNTVRIKQDPASGKIYTVENSGAIKRVNFSAGGTVTFTTVYQKAQHGLNAPLGIAFGKDGTMFLAGNDSTSKLGSATVVKGVPDAPGSENRTWSVLAQTVLFQFGNVYNHRVNGIIVDTSGKYVYVNSGAATDHGELRDGKREVVLPSIIWKLPVDSQNIILQDDREWLRSNGYLLAEGIRNHFDFAMAGNGDVFGVENSGDRDDPEELNWIREGHHYGFPWRIGGNNTPQQYAPYDPHTDPLLSSSAWGGGSLYTTFSNDPTYPPPPVGVVFTEPILSTGPDADKYRDTTNGNVIDASSTGKTIGTFSTHRSPDGIVFDRDSVLSPDLAGGGFVISLNNGALLNALGDTGEDLLHVALTKHGDTTYTAVVTRLVSGIKSPLGIELVGNILYVAETGLWGGNNSPKLWEITLPSGTTSVQGENINSPIQFILQQNYPNPFNPSTKISYSIPQSGNVTLKIFDVLGKEIASLVNGFVTSGYHEIQFDAKNLSAGIYFYTVTLAGNSITKKMILLK